MESSPSLDNFLSQAINASTLPKIAYEEPKMKKFQKDMINFGFLLAVLLAFSFIIIEISFNETKYYIKVVFYTALSLVVLLFVYSFWTNNRKRININLVLSTLLIALITFLLTYEEKLKLVKNIETLQSFSGITQGSQSQDGSSQSGSDSLIALVFQAIIKEMSSFAEISARITRLGYFTLIFIAISYLVLETFSYWLSAFFFGLNVYLSYYTLNDIAGFKDKLTYIQLLVTASFSLTVIVFKYYFIAIYENSTKHNRELKEIKHFYRDWVENMQSCYGLFKENSPVYKNKAFTELLTRVFGKEFNLSELLSKATAFESTNPAVNGRVSLWETLNLSKSTDCFEVLGIFKLDKKHCQFGEDMYLKVVVKKYSKEYFELLLLDVSALVHHNNKRIENKFRQTLFGKIAHEFKTPLNNIVCLLKNLTEKNPKLPLSSVTREFRNIKGLCDYVLHLVMDVTSYAKKGHSLDIRRTSTDMVELMEFCYNVLVSLIKQNDAKSKRIVTKLNIEIPENFKLMMIDQVRVKQVILNLISNAVKFTRHGEIQLFGLINEEHCVLGVKDTGIGMSKQRFKEIESGCLEIRQEYNEMGSGLGVNICRAIADSMELEFKLESEEHVGTTGTLSLPLSSSKALTVPICSTVDEIQESSRLNETELFEGAFDIRLALDAERLVSEHSNHSSPALKLIEDQINTAASEFVILAEDNSLMREALHRLVKTIRQKNRKAWEVIEVEDGAFVINTVVELVRRGKRVVCLITDEYMDFLNGSDCLLLIRKLVEAKKLREFPCFSCSSFKDDNYLSLLTETGVSGILDKPISKEGLECVFRKNKIL